MNNFEALIAGMILATSIITFSAWADVYILGQKWTTIHSKSRFKSFIYICAWETMIFLMGFVVAWVIR
jgi:hypothetical protein